MILQSEHADHWIQPIIQGFFDTKKCSITESDGYHSSTFHHNEVYQFTMSVLSRRSRHRAGTRYKRRGVDEEGNCANYVETEQVRAAENSFWQSKESRDCALIGRVKEYPAIH